LTNLHSLIFQLSNFLVVKDSFSFASLLFVVPELGDTDLLRQAFQVHRRSEAPWISLIQSGLAGKNACSYARKFLVNQRVSESDILSMDAVMPSHRQVGMLFVELKKRVSLVNPHVIVVSAPHKTRRYKEIVRRAIEKEQIAGKAVTVLACPPDWRMEDIAPRLPDDHRSSDQRILDVLLSEFRELELRMEQGQIEVQGGIPADLSREVRAHMSMSEETVVRERLSGIF
jgi:hypothetical protein